MIRHDAIDDDDLRRLIVTGHILAGNHDHKVVQPNLADIIHRRIIQAAAKIDPRYPGAYGLRQGFH